MAVEGAGKVQTREEEEDQEPYTQAHLGLPTADHHDPLDAKLEAVLFVAGEPVALSALAEILEAKPAEVGAAVDRLSEALQGRGLTLVRAGGTVQLTTAPEAATAVARFLHSEEAVTLSAAAMETLALIAYRQPVTRAQVEAVRGVSSDSPLKTLLWLGVVTELERLDQPGRPITYGTTSGFLRLFGFSSVDELPPLTEA